MWISSITTLTGWRRNLSAFLFGVCATLALPPVFAFPLLIPAFAGLYWLLNNPPPACGRGKGREASNGLPHPTSPASGGGGINRRRMFLDGWWWGWGHYISGLYWFVIALLTDVEKFAWLIPFTLFGLTAVIALYSAVACWLMAWVRVGGLARIAMFSALWTAVEFARGHWFTGFPWNLPGYVFTVSDSASQLASLVGIYGLSWIAVWLAAVWASRSRRAIIVSYVALALAVAWGGWRLHEADRIPESLRSVEGVKLRLVQANIPQHHKWDPERQMAGLKKHIALTRAPGLRSVTHVIWPETAVPFVVRPRTALTYILGNAIPAHTTLITGALRERGIAGTDHWQVWNSVLVIVRGGEIINSYDKGRLVPFGEFLPFRSILPDALLTPVGIKDFSRGPGPQTLDWPGLPPVSPLVCYEAIFPELAVDPGKRADWLLNLTNDAWFGTSSGPYQHFHMARFRAVEQGLPLVRVANTGITAVTDAWGRVLARIPLNKEGILDIALPKPVENVTVYSRTGDLAVGLALLLTIVIGLSQKNHKRIVKFLLQVVGVRK